MTPEEYEIMSALLDEYVYLCKMFLVKLNSHEAYINAHNLLRPAESKSLQPLDNPFNIKPRR